MTKTRSLLLSLALVGCGETAAPEGAATVAPVVPAVVEAPAVVAPAAPAVPAAPARIGTYGAFQLSVNTIAANGQCMEIAADLPADPAAAAAMLEVFNGMAVRTAGQGGPGAVSNTVRCPTEGRVPGVAGGCAMTMGAGAYVSYFYATGEHASTTEAAQAQCTSMHGVWTE